MTNRKAILYIRVSTDEQADKGHSLAHQEEKLRNYCAYHNIEIVALYKEDHSAKSFERPEFKAILTFLRKNKGKVDTLLFLKWDRFSRNAPEAYGMINTLAKLGVEPQAAEQPLDLEVPEQKIMLALYLTAPEVENDRRAMNVVAGMRRAKKEGRYLGIAPFGYRNARNDANKPVIVPNEKAAIVKETFALMASGNYHIDELRRMMNKKGLPLTRNAFWVMLRNPVYCGKVHVPALKSEPSMLVDGLHEPLVSEALFYEVQDVLDGKRRRSGPTKDSQREELKLRGFLVCPRCGNNLTGSAANGHGGRYFYYHCRGACKERVRADKVHERFSDLLSRISTNNRVLNALEAKLTKALGTKGTELETEAARLKKELNTAQGRLDNAQMLLLDGAISSADYSAMRTRLIPEISRLNRLLNEVNAGPKNEQQEIIRFGFYMLRNLPKVFSSADLEGQRRILGSTFPEKLVFENNECRTFSSDNILALIAKPSKDSKKKQEGSQSDFDIPSCSVARTGIEPVSKV